MRFDRIEVVLKFKGKVVWGYSNEIVCGRIPNPKLKNLKGNLEGVPPLLEEATQFPVHDGIWKKSISKKRRK